MFKVGYTINLDKTFKFDRGRGGEGRGGGKGYGKPKMRFDEVKYHIKGIKIMRVIMQFKSHRC